MDSVLLRRFRRWAAVPLLAGGSLAALLFAFPPTVSYELAKASIRHRDGLAYAAPVLPAALPRALALALVRVRGDSNAEPRVSRLELREDGRPLGAAHAAHADIALRGGGRFSHWDTAVIFAASDGSNPLDNGRRYSVSHPMSLSAWLTFTLLFAGVALALPESRRFLARTRRLRWTQRGALAFAGWTMVAVALVAGLAGLYLHHFPRWAQHPLPADAIRSWGGNAYSVTVPPLPAGDFARVVFLPLKPDLNESPMASEVRLLESGRPIGSPHSLHVEIVERGNGRFSHWGNELIFSSSDNSNPSTNGRSYAASYPLTPVLWIPIALLVFGIAAAATGLVHSSWRPWRRPGFALDAIRAAAATATCAGIALLCASIVSPGVSHDIDVASMSRWGGHAHAASLKTVLPGPTLRSLLGINADDAQDPSQSALRLTENGVRLGPAHTEHTEVAAKGAGRYSHWGNEIVFSASDNTSPLENGRHYAVGYLLAPPQAIGVSVLGVGLLVLLALTRLDPRRGLAATNPHGSHGITAHVFTWTTRHRVRIFLVAIALVAAYLNLVLAQLVTAPLVAPDSGGYLGWSPFRTLGYPIFLASYHAIFGTWDYLPVYQLNVLLLALAILSYAVARLTDSYVIGWILFAFVVGVASMLLSAADMLTEASFSAFVILHVAAVSLFLMRSSRWTGLLAGIALAAAILTKSVAVVLLGPLLLFLAFRRQDRRALATMVLAPALLAWFLPSAVNYARLGVFESSLVGGYALGGHVAWAIKPIPGSPIAEEAARIEARLRPVLAKRPAFKSWEEYVAYTANEYNTLLWVHASPELTDYYRPRCERERLECTVVVNKAFMRLSREAIMANPGEFAYHVAAHDLGLWRDSFQPDVDFLKGSDARAGWLPVAYSPERGSYTKTLGPRLPFLTPLERHDLVAGFEDSTLKKIADALTFPKLAYGTGKWLYRHPLVLFLFALAACLLVFRLSRISPAASACCYAALTLNAYFLGTALAQPSLARYAWTMQAVVAAMVLLGLFIVVRWVVDWARVAVKGRPAVVKQGVPA
jgi:hypothetical protein